MIELVKYDPKYDTDLERIQSLTPEKYHNFTKENYASPLNIARCIVLEDGKVIGAAFLKIIAEAIIILDLGCERSIRAEALDKIFKRGIMEVQLAGLDGIHAFTFDSPEFDKVLEHRFKFEKAGNAFFLVL